MRRVLTMGALGLLGTTVPALAQDRDYCPTRPGLGTTPCTISPGRVSIETGLADWTRDDSEDTRTDTVLIADTLVRIGLSERIEAQIAWTPLGHVRERDKATGDVERATRVGDVLLGAKVNLRHPDGSGLSIGVAPFVTLPVGRSPIGTGDWGAGAVIPVSYDLTDALNLQFSPEIDAATDEDGDGRHLAYSGTLGLAVALSESVTATAEVQALRDRDPDGHATELLGALSAAWMPTEDLQLDIGGNVGLDHDAPDVELYLGVSVRL